MLLARSKNLDFNELVAVDTFEVELPWRKLKLLNIVDIGTRFQTCIPLWKGIEARHVRKAFRRNWKRWAGAPRTVISDGGPEFGTSWTDHLSGDGTEHSVTAAYAPWQNGVCERLGGEWKVAFRKALLEVDPQSKEEAEELCDQLNYAHNSMTRVDGFSPHQHVLGADVRVPLLGMLGEGNETQESALHEKEDRHMRAQKIRSARKAFLDADSESKLKRAIYHRSRPNRGAKVYRCEQQVKHVDTEIVVILVAPLRSWKSTLRERGEMEILLSLTKKDSHQWKKERKELSKRSKQTKDCKEALRL